MKYFKTLLSAALLLAASTMHADNLSNKFQTLPNDQRVAVYWYWMSDNISVQGVEHDLEAMKKAGITRAFIGNIWVDEVKPGKIKVLSPEWWEVIHAALRKASELDIEIGIFNCPGWTQSGGPWIKPTQAMRYLKQESIEVSGNGSEQTLSLPSLGDEATDVCVLAVPTLNKAHKTIMTLNKKKDVDLTYEEHFPQPLTLRNITFTTDRYLMVDVVIQAKVDGEYKTLKIAHLDRSNTAINTGFHPYAPISINLPDTQTQDVRLIVCGGPQDCLFQATVSDESRIERYAEKTLAKMFQYPLPMWGEYMWPLQPEAKDYTYVQPEQVVNLSAQMSADGKLTWNVPTGRWTIMRCGMVPTGQTNAPASKEATGYEVDKMSRKHVAAHFDAFLGEILRRVPAKDRTTFKVVVEDSYETGGENWTDDFIESFKKAYGYDPVPFIPAYYGTVIGSQDKTERFLWDVRRLIADRVAYDYVGGLRDVSHQHGLTTWLECYGHWGFPSEFLMYGGQSDEVAGEFWSEGSLGDIENRAASSCAHIYGKQKVWAESCTAGGPNFSRYPAVMKQRTDRFFCEGINATLLHLFIQQPDDTTLPGVSAPFGNDFQRKNTWFQHMDLFTDYLRRCNLLLQQGRYVADVAYFIGEDCPKMTGECNPALPRGYSFDYINAEVIMQSVVRNGRLCLPSGMEYSVLVLPNQQTIRPNLLQKLGQLVKDGLTIVGPQPTASPSLKNYPADDMKVKMLANALWSNPTFGKGKVYGQGTELQPVLDALNVKADCFVADGKPYAFIHRTMEGREIYFVSNQSDEPQTLPTTFRVSGMKPQWWNPVTAERLSVKDFTDDGQLTSMTLSLAANESAFIVFEKEADTTLPAVGTLATIPLGASKNFAVKDCLTDWTVSFQKEMRGPNKPIQMGDLRPLNEMDDPAVKYYSGLTTYTSSFRLAQVPEGPIYLDLGKVMVMAKVYVNGKYAGGAWTAPYRVLVTDLLRKGKNTVRIEVTNNWQNRLIGDQQLPEAERPTWTSVNPWQTDSPLQESGLIGPVKLLH